MKRVQLLLKSPIDGIVSYIADVNSRVYHLRFTRDLTPEELDLLTVTAAVGTLETVRALELPFWDVSDQGGPSWYSR